MAFLPQLQRGLRPPTRAARNLRTGPDMAHPTFRADDALLIVDVQRDFCPGGALGIPEGDCILPTLNDRITQARAAGSLVLASRDWHPKQHVSFQKQGGPWPEHCVQDTEGAKFHPDLQLPQETVLISKGVRLDKDQYSAFEDTGLAVFLRQHGVKRVWVMGLAQDVCVRATVLAGCEEGLEMHLIANGTRPIDEEAGKKAVAEMQRAGTQVEEPRVQEHHP